MNTPKLTMQQIADEGAKAALIAMHNLDNFNISVVEVDENAHCYGRDRPAREAMCTKAIELHEAQRLDVGPVPTIDECWKLYSLFQGGSYGAIEVVRALILNAVAANNAAKPPRLLKLEIAQLHRQLRERDAALAKVRELPGKWRNYVSADRCILELEAALGSLNAPAKIEDVPAVPEHIADPVKAVESANTCVNFHNKTVALKERDAQIENLSLSAFELASSNERKDAEIVRLKGFNATLANRSEESEVTIRRLEAELALVQERLALLEWRPVNVKPTREDADAEGEVSWTDGKITWCDSIGCNDDSRTHWRPAALPPQPSAEEKERARFEAWYAENAFDFVANPIGSRECGLQWKAWQAARKEKP